jgi:hypothetical protein
MRNSKALAFVSSVLLSAALHAADLSGRVTVSGAPLPGAVVKAELIESGHRPAAVSVTRTGSDGEYLLRGLRNGDYILLVDTNGRRVYQGRIALPAAGLVKNIDLQRK